MRVSLLALVTLQVAPLVSGHDALPTCPLMTLANLPTYHKDATCERTPLAQMERHEVRSSAIEMNLPMGGVSHIPNQETIVCPMDPKPLESIDGGHLTKWIVENKSSGPIVLAFVRDGKEYSAVNSHISPPLADPEAILSPGQWLAVQTFEGHVFYAREINEDGSAGIFLLQHRTGLIGFTNRYNKELKCGGGLPEGMVEETSEAAQSEPEHAPDVRRGMVHETTSNVQGLEQQDETSPRRKSAAQMTLSQEQATHPKKPQVQPVAHPKTVPEKEEPLEHCNVIYQGFRNMLPNDCELDVYYAGMHSGIAPAVDGPMTCQEKYKFHLGVQDRRLDNYMEDWESRVRFQTTFVGHTYVARLATDPSVVVDHVTLQATEIHDCPSRKEKAITATVESVANPLGVWDALFFGNDTETIVTPFMEQANRTEHVVWMTVGSSFI